MFINACKQHVSTDWHMLRKRLSPSMLLLSRWKFRWNPSESSGCFAPVSHLLTYLPPRVGKYRSDLQNQEEKKKSKRICQCHYLVAVADDMETNLVVVVDLGIIFCKIILVWRSLICVLSFGVEVKVQKLVRILKQRTSNYTLNWVGDMLPVDANYCREGESRKRKCCSWRGWAMAASILQAVIAIILHICIFLILYD